MYRIETMFCCTLDEKCYLTSVQLTMSYNYLTVLDKYSRQPRTCIRLIDKLNKTNNIYIYIYIYIKFLYNLNTCRFKTWIFKNFCLKAFRKAETKHLKHNQSITDSSFKKSGVTKSISLQQ